MEALVHHCPGHHAGIRPVTFNINFFNKLQKSKKYNLKQDGG